MLRTLPSFSAAVSRQIGVRHFAVGTVKWFNNAKGFGFIQGDDNADVFVHQSNIKSNTFRMLEEGERVRGWAGGGLCTHARTGVCGGSCAPGAWCGWAPPVLFPAPRQPPTPAPSHPPLAPQPRPPWKLTGSV